MQCDEYYSPADYLADQADEAAERAAGRHYSEQTPDETALLERRAKTQYEQRQEVIAARIEELRRDPGVIGAIVQTPSFPDQLIFGAYTATSADYISRLAAFAERIDQELRDIAESEYAVKQHCIQRHALRQRFAKAPARSEA